MPEPSPHTIMRIIDMNMNMDGAMDFDEDITDWQSYRDGSNCTICGYESKKNLKRHIMTKHMPSSCPYEKCPTCNKDFNVTSGSFYYHMRRGHIDLTGKQIIKVNDDPEKGFILVRDPTLEKVYQVVFIPWVNRDGDRVQVQVSIGVTQCADVEAYATGIWSSVMASFKKRHMSIVACGSAINATKYHRIVMYTAGAFVPDIYGCTLTVANKAKGYLRELLDSIRHIAANDVFGYLDPVEAHIIRCLKGVIHTGQLPVHSLNNFKCARTKFISLKQHNDSVISLKS